MIQNLLLLKNKSILFAEDDMVTQTQMTGILAMLFDKVFTAANGEEAYALYEDESPDIILTDIKMPKIDGLSLIEKIRRNDYETPIILLTSFADKTFLLNAANLSIDGYLVKPIDLETLTSVLCKAIERSRSERGIVTLDKGLMYNSATQKLYRNGTVVELGSKEEELLVLLINNRHRTLTKEEIEKKLWPIESISSSTIKKLIYRIREKVKSDIIICVRGIGYRLDNQTISKLSA